MKTKIATLIKEMEKELEKCQNLEEKINEINEIKLAIHSLSPFKDQPVDCVLWIDNKNVFANSWNPNHVAPPEMKLLYTSIECDGYTQPIVTGKMEETGYEIVDGYHRNLILKSYPDIYERTKGYLPIVMINKEKSDRIASTIRHNRARGSHEVDLMGNIIRELHDLGRSDDWISLHLGMDKDEILRLKQITGLAELFKEKEFSQAWDRDENQLDHDEDIINYLDEDLDEDDEELDSPNDENKDE